MRKTREGVTEEVVVGGGVDEGKGGRRGKEEGVECVDEVGRRWREGPV